MFRPPPCPVCKSDEPPRLNLIGPKGIPLKLPNVLAVSGTPDTFWPMVTQLRITPKLVCPACSHAYTWEPPT